ncbi:hypothetical protein M5K25_020972 [Dendrobium thyrsiflorum]|uniref:Uncharacterized protein n=1 Tax=Dendrobium thyrsiflorum TaxID=117978 RepID=A0ABD0UBC4_DENTH
MATKKMVAWEGEMEQLKARMDENYSGMEGRNLSIENCFKNLEGMMKKMIEMQSKSSLAIPVAEPKEKEIQEGDHEVEKSIVDENQPSDFEVQIPTSKWIMSHGNSTDPIQNELYKIQEKLILCAERYEKRKSHLQAQFIHETEVIQRRYAALIQELDMAQSAHDGSSESISSGDEISPPREN